MRRVLLIEDSETCAKLTELWLKRYDPEALCDKVVSLREGLAHLTTARETATPYDLVILDLTLLDTSELMAVAPTVAAARPSPVLIFTNGLAEWRDRALHDGASLYVLKRDTDREKFCTVVGDLLDHAS